MSTEAAAKPEAPCQCEAPEGALPTAWLWRHVGIDETGGRFADVAIYRCETCGRLWLRYFVEYEAFLRSSRWARGLIDAATAETIKPEEAPPYLARLRWAIVGGGVFGGVARRGSGAVQW